MALTAALLRKIVSFHSKCVRWMCRITLEHTKEHRIRTTTLEKRLGIRDIQATIDDLRMRWLGHVARMPLMRLPRRFLTSWVKQPRQQGGQRMSTAQCIKDTIRRAGLDPEDWIGHAQDREAWRLLCQHVEPKARQAHARPLNSSRGCMLDLAWHTQAGREASTTDQRSEQEACTASWH